MVRRSICVAVLVAASLTGCWWDSTGSQDMASEDAAGPSKFSAEVKKAFGADPNKSDTDGDGLTDEFEITYGYPIIRPDRADSNGNGIADGDEDTDGDGLTNKEEQALGTNPLNPDTDSDGLADGAEAKSHRTNPLVADTDGDGVSDGREVANASNPLVADANIVVTSKASRPIIDPDTGRIAMVSIAITGAGDISGRASIRVKTDARVPGQVGRRVDVDLAEADSSNVQSGNVVLSYDPTDANANDPSDLAIFTINPITKFWEKLPSSVDSTANTISASTTHFSPFIVAKSSTFVDSINKIPKTCDKITDPDAAVIDVALVIDSSGSMSSNDPSDIRVSAAQQFVSAMKAADRAAVVDFDNSAYLYQSLTSNKSALVSAIARIDSSGGTNIGAGVAEGINQLTGATGSAPKVLILLTDGDGSYSSSLTAQMASAGIRAFTIGLTGAVNETLLKSIADGTQGKYYKIASANGLLAIFNDLQTVFGDDGSDRDHDGLTDCQEIQGVYVKNLGRVIYTDPDNPDTDGDGILDGAEVGLVEKTATTAGVSSGVKRALSAREQKMLPSASNPIAVNPWASDGYSDPTKTDSDGDGLDDFQESDEYTSPLTKDGDGDGILDQVELNNGSDPEDPNDPIDRGIYGKSSWQSFVTFGYKLVDTSYQFGEAAVLGGFAEIDSWPKFAGATARNFIPSCGVLDGLDTIAAALDRDSFGTSLSFAATASGAAQCGAVVVTGATAGVGAPLAVATTGADVATAVAKEVKIAKAFIKTVGYSEKNINKIYHQLDKINVSGDLKTSVLKPIIEELDPDLLARIKAGGLSDADAVQYAAGVRKGEIIQKLGKVGEEKVRAVADIGPKPTKPIDIDGRMRLPDGINNDLKTVNEVKNVSKLSYTRQLRDYSKYAKSRGYTLVVWVREGAALTQPLKDAEAAGNLVIKTFKP